MDLSGENVLTGLVVVGAVAVGIAWYFQSKKNKKEREAIAAKYGWTMRPRDDRLPDRWASVFPFNDGRLRHCQWVFEGKMEGTPIMAFQYNTQHNRIGDSSDKTQSVTSYQVAVVRMPMDGRELSITKEGIFDKVGDAVTGADIDFESDAFSRKFAVRCRDRKFAYDVITPTMMEYLMPTSKWTWHWLGNDLVMYRTGDQEPKDVVPTINQALGFKKLLPRHLTAA